MELLIVVVEVVLLFLSSAVCVLGQPQPSEVHEMDSAVTVPFRRFLRGKGGGGGGARFVGGGGGSGGGSVSTKEIIIIVCSIVGFFPLLIAFKIWHVRKLKKNPDWRFADVFKRKKPDADKFATAEKSATVEKAATVEKPATDEKKFVLVS